MRRFFLRLANLFSGTGTEREMFSRKVESHLALMADEFERRGMAPEAARLAARRAYGGVEQAKELHRDARSFLWVEQRVKDVRHGARSLLRTPAFTAVAVTTLALGIGANTAVFSVVNAVLPAPLAYHDPERLVTILNTGRRTLCPPPTISTGASRAALFAAMAAAESIGGVNPPPAPSSPNTPSASSVTQNLLPNARHPAPSWGEGSSGGGRPHRRGARGRLEPPPLAAPLQ